MSIFERYERFKDIPSDAVDCLGCLSSSGNRECNHDECKGVDVCLIDDCPDCEGEGWITAQ